MSSCTNLFLCISCEKSKCCPCSTPKSPAEVNRSWTGGVVLLICATLFILIGVFMPRILNNALVTGLQETQILTSEDDMAFKMFVNNIDQPIMVSVMMMNILNAEKTLEGEKPELEEVGPFVYKYIREAINISWNENFSEISFVYKENFILDENSMDDKNEVTTMNIPFWTIAFTEMYSVILDVIETSENYKTPLQQAYTTRSVHDILFGYPDKMMEAAHQEYDKIPATFTGIFTNDVDKDAAIERVKPTTFGTGWPKYRDLHQLKKIDGSENVKNKPWRTAEHNRIHGSDGGVFPAPLIENEPLSFYAASFYRNINLKFIEKHKHKNIDVFRYEIPDTVWKNATEYPENENYQQTKDVETGLIPIKPVVDANMFLSLPHFQGAPQPRKMIEVPTWSTDGDVDFTSYFDVEPISGATMNIYLSSQLNMPMNTFTATVPDPDSDDPFDTIEIEFFPELEKYYFPIFWSDQTAGINDEDAKTFSSIVNGVLSAIKNGPTVAYCLAAFFGILGFIITTRSHLYSKIITTPYIHIEGTDNTDNMFDSNDRNKNSIEAINLDNTRAGPNKYGAMGHRNTQVSSGVYDPSLNKAAAPHELPAEFRENVYIADNAQLPPSSRSTDSY